MAPSTDRTSLARPLGIIAILTGLVLNPWFFIELAPDGDIESRVILGAIIVFDLALLALGAWLIRARPHVQVRDLALLVGSGLLVLLLIEAAFHLPLAGEREGTLRLDDTLGWEPKPHYVRAVDGHRVYGDLRYTSTRDGFRRFGDLEADRIRILFLGDSGTQATQVSDGEAYFDHIADRRDDVEVFAHGAGGYGNLQEYMVMDQFFDEIRPDLVVLQLTPNDIMNNSYDLESRSAFNSRMRRPFLEDGEIVHRFPSRNPLVRYSRLGRFIAIRLGFIGADNIAFLARSIEYRIDETRELWDEAVRTTEEILRLMVARAGDVPVVAFEVAPSYLEERLFPELCERVGIAFVDGIPAAVDSARAAGEPVDFAPHDGHWNAVAHAIAGEAILRFLIEEGLLPKRGG